MPSRRGGRLCFHAALSYPRSFRQKSRAPAPMADAEAGPGSWLCDKSGVLISVVLAISIAYWNENWLWKLPFTKSLKGDQPWVFFGRNDAKAETPVLWPPHANSYLTEKTLMLGGIGGRRRRGRKRMR